MSSVKQKVSKNSKENILREIQKAVKEVKLIKQGKLKGISAKDILNEL